MTYLLLISVTFWSLWYRNAVAAATTTATNILKCCPDSQALNSRKICENYDDGGKTWTPQVYSPQLQTFRQPGTLPPNFTFLQGTPRCNFELLYFPASPTAVLIESDGSLYVGGNDAVVPPQQFCISPLGMLLCVADRHPLNNNEKFEKRVKKCCIVDSVYSEAYGSCISVNDSSKINFLSEDTFIHSGFPQCDSKKIAIVGKLDEEYSLNVDGTLRTKNKSPVANYCVEYVLERRGEQKASVFRCVENTTTTDAATTTGSGVVTADNQHSRDIRYTIYPFGFFLSIFFLSITLIASCTLPTSLHWKCQTHYVTCLLIGDLLLAIAQIAGSSLKNSVTCVGLATAMHFFFLAAFFWLNTMCFNIWWTFRDLRPTSLDKGQETYRLVVYELYAWGGPLVIVSVGAAMDQFLTDNYSTALKPKFGDIRCWFAGNTEMFVYFFGPVGLLLLINLILFLATTRELTCGLWKKEAVKSTTERTALSRICLKLVIVMGITWIVDVVSWAVGGPDYLWYLTDLVNCTQGVFIFIVVGCQPHIWSTWKRMWCLADSLSRNSAAGRSYSSNATPSIINDHSSTKPVETLC